MMMVNPRFAFVLLWLAVFPAVFFGQTASAPSTETSTAAPVPIPVKLSSYEISRRQTASLYEKAELLINDSDMSWEIVLYKKGGNSEHIKMEKFDDIGRNLGVFRTITIQEGGKPAYRATSLFAYMPVFNGGKIQIELCDTRTESVRRRIILES